MNVVNLKNAVRLDPNIVAEVVKITPETASQWLKANSRNRPVRRRHVEFLAGEMTRGEWQVNGQAIVISDNEEVLDGQHRLMAIIESGETVRTLVVYGIKPDAFKTIDTGAARTGKDALALEYPDTTISMVQAIGVAVPWCMRLESGFLKRRARISNTQTLEYVRKHETLWHCAEYVLSLPIDAAPLSRGCGTALYEVFQRKDEEKAETFIRALFTGELLSKVDPEYVLRQRLIRDAQRLSKYPQDIKMRMCVKAWNWRRRGMKDTPQQAIVVQPKDPEKCVVL